MNGYIPNLITNFVAGQFPDNISAIIFNKTIAIFGNYYFKGYRMRILLNNVDPMVIDKCKNFIGNDFVEEDRKFAKCVAKLTIPNKLFNNL